MKPYTNYTVRLGDLKDAIKRNPYDPTRNIDGYMRYLKYNTLEAEPERRRGEWIDLGKDKVIRWRCSECGRKDTHIYNYCPDCGSDNRWY